MSVALSSFALVALLQIFAPGLLANDVTSEVFGLELVAECNSLAENARKMGEELPTSQLEEVRQRVRAEDRERLCRGPSCGGVHQEEEIPTEEEKLIASQSKRLLAHEIVFFCEKFASGQFGVLPRSRSDMDLYASNMGLFKGWTVTKAQKAREQQPQNPLIMIFELMSKIRERVYELWDAKDFKSKIIVKQMNNF